MVITAREIGFCFGVKRAVSLCEKALGCHKNCVSLGPIIHNERVIEKLERSGLKIAASVDELLSSRPESKKGCGPAAGLEPVIIRSHGLHPDIRKKLDRKNRKIIDATCPFVRRVQKLVADLRKKGYTVVIVGKPDHPEVKALAGFAGKKVIICPATSRSIAGSGLNLKNLKRVAVVSQTTNTERSYRSAVRALRRLGLPDGTSFLDTVCRVTERRQTEAAQLAEKVDVLLVVGSGKSANTTNLYRFLRRIKPETYLIAGAEGVKKKWCNKNLKVGLVSGTSTPTETIEEIKKQLKNN